ncbi:MAG: 1-deoxy-D-xylulose-5-phosphate synthase [Firmicutes bacterium]|nr:1-deoxy-D-xylulose-5-phosphate synthase [Bacillota bacterium]
MTAILPTIKSPHDVRRLAPTQLRVLARELREEIVRVVAKNGGHLASNLGVVELTLALHRTFDFSQDKLIWDVGHQTYAHKLITGRYHKFSTLRQFGGLSGFPKPAESSYDHFVAGHSSTSISAALGMAIARDLAGERHHVVAVIGDGALTGGMAWEALNHAGDLGEDLIVVLNDNEMSIAENVGAMSRYLARVRTAPGYLRTKADIEALLQKIPRVGGRVAEISERLKDSLKYLLVAGMLFEELGFTYLGPVDGHNLMALEEMLTVAKSTPGPVLVHCQTIKGKGYRPAVTAPDHFHGVGAFDPATGEAVAKASVPTYTRVFSKTLLDIAKKNEQIVAITAAMPTGTGLDAFQEKYPDRFFDVGIAEQHAVTLAAGMAAAGLRPVFAVYSTFLQRAYDQVIHDVCLPNLPVVLAIDRGGLVGDDGETHQGVFDMAMLRQMPNMTIMLPRNAQELVNMLVAACEHPGPVAIRYPRGTADGEPLLPAQPVPIGRSQCLRSGRDVLLVNCGTIWDVTEQVEAQLLTAGLQPTVYDLRFLKPLDSELVAAMGNHRLTVVIEEGIVAGGCGSALLEAASNAGVEHEALLFGIPDRFIPHGKRHLLLASLGLTGEAIGKRILAKLEQTKHGN